MIWADRAALVWAVIVWGFVALSGQLADHGAANLALLVTLAPWFLLRAVDFLFTGRIRAS